MGQCLELLQVQRQAVQPLAVDQVAKAQHKVGFDFSVDRFHAPLQLVVSSRVGPQLRAVAIAQRRLDVRVIPLDEAKLGRLQSLGRRRSGYRPPGTRRDGAPGDADTGSSKESSTIQ